MDNGDEYDHDLVIELEISEKMKGDPSRPVSDAISNSSVRGNPLSSQRSGHGGSSSMGLQTPQGTLPAAGAAPGHRRSTGGPGVSRNGILDGDEDEVDAAANMDDGDFYVSGSNPLGQGSGIGGTGGGGRVGFGGGGSGGVPSDQLDVFELAAAAAAEDSDTSQGADFRNSDIFRTHSGLEEVNPWSSSSRQ